MFKHFIIVVPTLAAVFGRNGFLEQVPCKNKAH